MNDVTRDDRRAFFVSAGVVMVAFSLGAALQTVFVFRPARIDETDQFEAGIDLSLRVGINVLAVALALILCALIRISERTTRVAVRLGLGVAAVAGSVRFGAQCLAGLYPQPTLRDAAVEIGSTVMVVLLGIAVGLAQIAARRRIREQGSVAAEQRLRASAALASLAAEESRVRREVADDLHGTLQGRIVIVQAQIEALVRAHEARGDTDALLAGLGRVRDELDRIRETEIRAVSHRLHPAGVTLGVGHALRLLVGTIPPEVEVETVISPAVEAHAPRPGVDALRPDADVLVRRVALFRAAEEAVTNALRHGRASRLRVELDRPHADALRVRIDDDGSGLRTAAPRSGVALIAERLEALGGSVDLEPSAFGGVRVVASVPERATGDDRHPRRSVDSEP